MLVLTLCKILRILILKEIDPKNPYYEITAAPKSICFKEKLTWNFKNSNFSTPFLSNPRTKSRIWTLNLTYLKILSLLRKLQTKVKY